MKKKLKLKLSLYDTGLLLSALSACHAMYEGSMHETRVKVWSERVAAHLAVQLTVRINKMLVEEQEQYTIRLDKGEALTVHHMMQVLTSDDINFDAYHKSVYRRILQTIDQALA